MKRKINVFMIVMSSVLMLYAISLMVPIIWTLLTSLKSRGDFVENIFGLPKKYEFKNYLTAIENFFCDVPTEDGVSRIYIEEMVLNSILYAVGCSFFNVAATCVAGYMICKYSHWPICKLIYTFVFVAMSLPIVGSLPSEIQMAKSLQLYNKIYGMWIMKTYFLDIYFFVFFAYFKNIPKSFEEAAIIDGASNLRVFLNIMVPLARSMFFTVMLIKFIGFWNDYQTPYVYMPSKPTIALGLYYYSTSPTNELTSVPLKLAGCIIVLLPTLILFLIFHKKLIGNISIGSGVKG